MHLQTLCDAAAERALAYDAGECLFDLDGTLIHGDIGESALEVALRAGGSFDWHAYHALVATEDAVARSAGAVEQGVRSAVALAGLTVRETDRLVDTAFAEGLVRPQDEVVALAHRLAQKHRVWILTGSLEVLGRAVGKRLGLDHVIGLKLAMKNGKLTDTVVPPLTLAEGKVRAAWVSLGRRPVFAIGDSPWDRPVLEFAHTRLGIARAEGIV